MYHGCRVHLCDGMGKFGGVAMIVGLTVALAGLDLVESVLAKEWSLRRNHWLLLAGITTSLLLFALFVVAMRYTEMSTVTLGWIVALQTGLMITEQARYGVHHSADRWIVVAMMVALQGYLLSTSGGTSSSADA